MASAWGTSWGASFGNSWGTVAVSGIVNTEATQPTANSYNVCQRSGKRYKPGALVQEWTGLWVYPDYLDHRSQQDFVRVHAEKLDGSIRPEAQDVFLSDNEVTLDDL